MIDTLIQQLSNLKKPSFWDILSLQIRQYLVITLHRPANVDEVEKLADLLDEIIQHSRGLPLIFPVHPRTSNTLRQIGMNASNLHFIEPMGYLEFIYLIKNAKAVITDSGGITEETTVLSIPCMTLRDNTERPETVNIGTNKLLGTNPKTIGPALAQLFDGQWQVGHIPPLWDGKAAHRIVENLINLHKAGLL